MLIYIIIQRFYRKGSLTNHKHSERKHHHIHTHGTVDLSIVSTSKGILAVKWSFLSLVMTAVVQIFIVYISGCVALLAYTIHNFGDAAHPFVDCFFPDKTQVYKGIHIWLW
jgi:Co/Zn/Cd efflux system component